MSTENEKPVLKFLKKSLVALKKFFASPIVRGTIKTVPVGNLAYEIADMLHGKKNHHPLSMLVQTVLLGFVLYAVFVKKMNIDQALELLQKVSYLLSDLLSGGVGDSGPDVSVIDSLAQ